MDAGTDPAVIALFVVMIGNILHQHRENTKTRDLIVQTNNDTRSELRGDIKDLDTRLTGQITELKRTTEKNHDELRTDHNELKATVERNHNELRNGLGDTRERLARIEGHLGIGAPPSSESPAN